MVSRLFQIVRCSCLYSSQPHLSINQTNQSTNQSSRDGHSMNRSFNLKYFQNDAGDTLCSFFPLGHCRATPAATLPRPAAL